MPISYAPPNADNVMPPMHQVAIVHQADPASIRSDIPSTITPQQMPPPPDAVFADTEDMIAEDNAKLDIGDGILGGGVLGTSSLKLNLDQKVNVPAERSFVVGALSHIANAIPLVQTVKDYWTCRNEITQQITTFDGVNLMAGNPLGKDVRDDVINVAQHECITGAATSFAFDALSYATIGFSFAPSVLGLRAGGNAAALNLLPDSEQHSQPNDSIIFKGDKQAYHFSYANGGWSLDKPNTIPNIPDTTADSDIGADADAADPVPTIPDFRRMPQLRVTPTPRG